MTDSRGETGHDLEVYFWIVLREMRAYVAAEGVDSPASHKGHYKE